MIDKGVLNEHSGAESNIVAAEALFTQVARDARALLRAADPWLSSSLSRPLGTAASVA